MQVQLRALLRRLTGINSGFRGKLCRIQQVLLSLNFKQGLREATENDK